MIYMVLDVENAEMLIMNGSNKHLILLAVYIQMM